MDSAQGTDQTSPGDAPDAPKNESAAETGGSSDAAAETTTSDGAPDGGADGAGSGCTDPTTVLYVAPGGSDTDAGNGSSNCPFKTITNALAHVGHAGGAGAAQTIELEIGTYGAACTGGPPCDTTPIVIADAGALTIRGTQTGGVVVTGGGTAVFSVTSPAASFETMTIVPTEIGAPGTVGHGILFNAALGTMTPTVTSVQLQLANASMLDAGADAGPGTGIVVTGGVSPTVGPGVIISGGYLGIDVSGTSAVTITGTTVSPTIVSGSGGSNGCIRVKSDDTTPAAIRVSNGDPDAGAGPVLQLTNCSPTVEIDTLFAGAGSTIDATQLVPTGSFVPGMIVSRAAKVSLSNSTMSVTYNGFNISGTANVAFDHFTQTGVYYPATVTGNATVSANFYTLKNSVYSGLDCGDSVQFKFRNSTFVANDRTAINIGGACVADLGTAADPGNNVFNLTSQQNGWAAICYTSSAGNIAASGNTWSCGNTSPTCSTSLSPTRITTPTDGGAFSCQAAVDIGSPTAAEVQATNPTCCD
jgi:hypothetical protein